MGLENIFQSIQIGPLNIPNRVVMAPMTRCFSPDGVPSEPVLEYYRRRAAANVGLIVTEGVGVDHPASIGDSGLGDANQPVLHGEAALAEWRKIVDSVHAEGGLIAPQLWHQGPLRLNGTGLHPEALSCRPSGIWGSTDTPTPFSQEVIDKNLPVTEAMSESDIADTIAAYANSAANAKNVGFDGIAIHGAHSYLLDSFIWEVTNQRGDRWGGSLDNRLRYGVEVIKAIRSNVGDMPIILRFSQWKQTDYQAQIAQTPDELGKILGAFADAGVDVFDASTRKYDAVAFPEVDANLSLAGWAKKLTGKPAMAVGGIGLKKELYESFGAGGSETSDNIRDVDARIGAGEFDFACVGRALIADPEWVTKTRNGQSCAPYDMEKMAELV